MHMIGDEMLGRLHDILSLSDNRKAVLSRNILQLFIGQPEPRYVGVALFLYSSSSCSVNC